ncbi:MAG: hypothetical protein WKF84_12060 [Pyrinomonadaceae bacterium]
MSDTESTNAVRVHAVVDQLEDGNVAVLLLGDDERTAVDVPVEHAARRSARRRSLDSDIFRR